MRGAQVTIRFIEPSLGGRKVLPSLKTYRPHFRVGEGEYLGVVFVEGPEELMSFTNSFNVVVSFVYPNVCYDALQAGVEFEIMEGPLVIGYGKVVTLL